jgi:hypothetical protein
MIERIPQKERRYPLEPIYPHGDVDDMIYQEEWTASGR